MPSVTAVYASMIALLFVGLSAKVILLRRGQRISVGDGGDAALLRAMRTHANCAEYAPFALLLLMLAELQSASAGVLHLLGSALLLGRLTHAYGFGRDQHIMILRQVGMVLTFSVIIIAALVNLVLAL